MIHIFLDPCLSFWGRGFSLVGNAFVSDEERWLPLYEAKLMHIYTHRYGDFTDSGGKRAHILPEVDKVKLAKSDYLPAPYYWVSEAEVEARSSEADWNRKWFIAFRKVTDSRASARTLISSVLPYVGSGDSLNLMLPGHFEDSRLYAVLLGNLSSLVLDYVVRNKVGGLNLNYFAMRQFPVLPPENYGEADIEFIVPRVLQLTYTSVDMRAWAADLGCVSEPFSFNEVLRSRLQAELDAYYARLYGLNRCDLEFIVDPESAKPGYPSETFSVLKRNEIREFGEYRTKKLVLEAWDKLEQGELV